MDVTSSGRLNHEQGSAVLASVIEHLQATKTGHASVRSFFRLYDQYVPKVRERAWQLIVEGELSNIALRAVQRKFCVDVEGIEPLIDLKLFEDIRLY